MSARSTPRVGDPPRLGQLDIQSHRFDNGLLLACVEQRNLPIVDVEVVVRAGAALDQPRQAGRAMMVAEMLDEGTHTRDVMQIADAIDFLGAHLSISAGWDTTVLGLHVLSPRLPDALDILVDVLTNPAFPVSEYERKKRERLTALLQDQDEARIAANKALARGVFGTQHPYGMPTSGTYTSIEAQTLADVRAFYDAHFKPADTFIVVVGDVSFPAMVAELGARFAHWQGTTSDEVVLPPNPNGHPTRILLVDKPRAAQAEIRVGHTAPPRDTPDYFPLVVLNTMLGGAFTSRLNLELRERMGVTYGASSKFGWRKRGGIFWAASAVDSHAAAESVGVVLAEMEKLRSAPVDPVEMERAARFIAYGLPRSFESTEDVAAHVREQILHGFPLDYWQKYVEQILAVTPAQVQDVAARHLHPAHAVGVVVADRSDVESKLEQLELGEVIITEVEA
jgi:predicted Zn-dependent peptidase